MAKRDRRLVVTFSQEELEELDDLVAMCGGDDARAMIRRLVHAAYASVCMQALLESPVLDVKNLN